MNRRESAESVVKMCSGEKFGRSVRVSYSFCSRVPWSEPRDANDMILVDVHEQLHVR